MKYLILILIVILCSCKKEHQIHIKVSNPVTGLSSDFAGLKYVVTETKLGYLNSKYKTVYEGSLNENGEDFAQVKMKHNNTYKITMDMPSDICYYSDIVYHLTYGETNTEANFEYVPCSYIKLIINNVNCAGTDDSLILYQGNGIGSFNEDFGWVHQGCVYWETQNYSDIPMGYQYYKWEVVRGGVKEVFYDTLYLAKGEYMTYEINY